MSDPREGAQHPVLQHVNLDRSLAIEAVCTLMARDALDLLDMLFAPPGTQPPRWKKRAVVRR